MKFEDISVVHMIFVLIQEILTQSVQFFCFDISPCPGFRPLQHISCQIDIAAGTSLNPHVIGCFVLGIDVLHLE